ncbi:MAG: isoprenylcysteine carboxylmethyltransferase family protein [bacterium]
MNPKARSIVATVLLALCLAALVSRHELLARHPAGLALQIAAVLLMIWARWTFGRRSFHAAADPTQGGLVTVGPYRYWRHPIYAAVLILLWAGVLSQRAVPTGVALLLALMATVFCFVRIQAEELLLRRTFPAYDAYAARTKRIIPFVA